MTNNDKQKLKSWISRYSINVDGKWVENGLIGWRTALAHARRYVSNLFDTTKKIEILNLYTSEIITLEEAEKRIQRLKR